MLILRMSYTYRSNKIVDFPTFDSKNQNIKLFYVQF